MDNYVTGMIIKKLREKKGFTQEALGEKLNVTGKTISKWETGNGFPDISLIELLAKELQVSVIELLSGKEIVNTNKSSNLLKSSFYICPICGNVIVATGNALVSCCGITLYKEEYEEIDDNHNIDVSFVENEFFVSISHEMSKTHYISFIAYINSNSVEIVKMYPESNAECRFYRKGHGYIVYYCNHHGLMKYRI